MLLGTTNPTCIDDRKGWGFPMTSALLAGALNAEVQHVFDNFVLNLP